MPELIIVDLPGDPYGAGVAHGRAAASLIEENLAIYYDRFQREAKLTPEETRERARGYHRVIERTAPEYAEAMRGVSEASGVALDDIAVLNARYEILYSQYSAINRQAAAAHGIPAGGCTAFAVTTEASADGHLYLGQNWDWFPAVRGLVLRGRGPDGLRTAAFTEAGIVGGKIGMNSAGLGLVINGLLSSQDDWRRLHTPFHVRTWRILQTRALEGALAIVEGEERSCSANFLIGQANGTADVVNVEAAPTTSRRLHPVRGLLAHANHFVDPDRLGVWQPLAEEKTSTYQRCARMEAMLQAWRDGHAGGNWDGDPYAAPPHHAADASRTADEAPAASNYQSGGLRDVDDLGASGGRHPRGSEGSGEGSGGASRLDLRGLMRLLRDHTGRPDSVCRHPNPALPEEERVETVVSVIEDLTARRFYVAPGPPCTHEFEEIPL